MSDSAWSLCPKLEDRLRYDLPVTVFQPNLTSRVLLKAAESVVSRVDGSILELGCGSGWISRSLIESCNVDPAVVHLSDISNLATSEAESNLENIVPRANIKTGDGLEPWFGSKFGLIINDIAGISDQIAAVSDWYRDIPYAAGTDGLSNSRNILSKVRSYLTPTGIYIVPLISLSDTTAHMDLLVSEFRTVSVFGTTWWPLPENLADEIEGLGHKFVDASGITLRKKYGKTLAFTEVAICEC